MIILKMAVDWAVIWICIIEYLSYIKGSNLIVCCFRDEKYCDIRIHLSGSAQLVALHNFPIIY